MFLMKNPSFSNASKRRRKPPLRFATANIVIFFELITISRPKNMIYMQN